ncbi:MAG: tetratricopeptide repeat protein [Pyrinomonadaceae bacterium]
MKRCPECGREYDLTMSFCLDDGNELLYGPGSGSNSREEPATAILHETGAQGEAPTRAQIHTTAAKPQSESEELSEKPSFSANRAAKPLLVFAGIAVVIFGGFFGYRYFSSGSSQQISSIAVMPFVNDGGGEDVEYLSDGMTEVLIGNLSKIPNLMVKARSSVFRYKGTNTDLKTIGKELSVDAILNGRITTRGDQIALSLELMDAATENVLWSERYDRKQGDLAELQTDIARDISNRIKTRISGEGPTSGGAETEDPEAYKAYLQGLFYFNKRTQKDYPKAIGYFQDAINKDPNFALAFVGKANAQGLWSESGLTESETLAKMEQDLNTALRLDPNLSPAYTRLAGNAFYWKGDWKEAERLYSRAIELDPGNSYAHHAYAEALCFRTRFDACFAEYERALAIDPLSPVINSDLGMSYFFSRQYDRAIAQLQKNIELNPSFVRNYKGLATIYEFKGEFESAIGVHEEEYRLELGPETASVRRKALEKALREKGSKGYWNQILEWNLARRGIDPVDGYWEAAANYTELGEKDKAFETLDQALQKVVFAKAFLATTPRFDKLRSDPRFKALLEQIGMAE